MCIVCQALYICCHLILSMTLQGEYCDFQVKKLRLRKAKWLGLCLMSINDGKAGIWTSWLMAKPTLAFLPLPFADGLEGLDLGIQPPSACCVHGKMQSEFQPSNLWMNFWHMAHLSVEDCCLGQVSIETKWICLAVVLKLLFQFKYRINEEWS